MTRRLRRGVTAIAAVTALLALASGTIAQSPARAGPIEASVVDDKGKPIEDAVVSLVPAAGATPVGPATTAVMDQVDKEFVPHVLAVPVGAAVRFPNRDNIKHHVYSFSPPKKFELPLYSGSPASPVIFDKPGVIVLGCNIHDWMVAYVYVAETPYFAKSAADGRARIADVPAGAWEARVWHPRMRIAPEKTTRAVTLPGADQLAWTLSLKRDWKPGRGPGRYGGVEN